LEAVRLAAEMIGGSGIPAVEGGKKVVEELHGGMGKLEVEFIGVEEGWR
jgi:hypothetical protein